MTKKVVYAGSALLATAFALSYAIARLDVTRDSPPQSPGTPGRRSSEALVLSPTSPLTVAAVGDTVISRPIAGSDKDAAFEAVARVLRGAHVTVANLEMNLLRADQAADASRNPGPRWTFGLTREAAELKALGFDVIGQANNHAIDYGVEGMSDTRSILTASGLIPIGSGQDLAEARAPVFVGSGPRKVAIVAVAISASRNAMATPTRGREKGWPGISALRYVADVTVDAQTYETLRRSATLQGGGETGGNQFTLFGTNIKKGTETSVDLVPDAGDIEEILAEVRRARAAAEVVVLSIHSHEPSNDSEEPAEFVEDFARQAIDAGAALVVGHGPHRLRGIEVYKRGAIVYSMGNFLYQLDGPPPSTDPFDAGVDMFSLAMGTSGASLSPGTASRRSSASSRFGLEREEWWQGAVALASFEDGGLRSLHVHPVDLGVDLPAPGRGIPRKPSAQRAASILERLASLSERYKTTIRIENGIGAVEIR